MGQCRGYSSKRKLHTRRGQALSGYENPLLVAQTDCVIVTRELRALIFGIMYHPGGCCRSCTKTALRMGLAPRMAFQCRNSLSLASEDSLKEMSGGWLHFNERCDVRNVRVLLFNSSILAQLVLIHAAFSNASESHPVVRWLAGCMADGWVVVSCRWVVGLVGVLVCPAILR